MLVLSFGGSRRLVLYSETVIILQIGPLALDLGDVPGFPIIQRLCLDRFSSG
jgi:hypothetical protein